MSLRNKNGWLAPLLILAVVLVLSSANPAQAQYRYYTHNFHNSPYYTPVPISTGPMVMQYSPSTSSYYMVPHAKTALPTAGVTQNYSFYTFPNVTYFPPAIPSYTPSFPTNGVYYEANPVAPYVANANASNLLAPYVLTSHMRDGVVWNVPDGAAVSWTRMGEGQIGIERYIGQYLENCPGCPVSLEVIVTEEPRVLAHRERGFWGSYRSMPAWELARFLALADRGARVQRRPAAAGESVASRELADVDASVEWTRAALARLVQAS